MEENINLTNALKKYFGFDTFKGNQEAIIRNLLAGNDTFVLMPTGGGKSLCYQLPSLIMEGTAIVISPLIALMKNQVDAMRNFSEEDGVAHFINSSLNKSAIDQVKSDILSGKTKLLYVAPESLTKEENVEFLRGVKISFYAVDEAHCISEWGHDFRPEYRRIRPIINEIGKAPVIALTATATPKVRMDIQKNLGMLDAAEFKSSFNRPNLYYEVRPKTNNIDRDIIKFIKANSGKSGIIYCLSRKKVEELAEILQANGINARAYHAGMDSATRTANQDGFLKEDIDVIVATIAFGMGIDKPDVRFVIHYDIPKSLEGYYQETGRAGRDGGEGMCITFYSNKDLQKLEKFMQGKPVAEQEIETRGRFDLGNGFAFAPGMVTVSTASNTHYRPFIQGWKAFDNGLNLSARYRYNTVNDAHSDKELDGSGYTRRQSHQFDIWFAYNIGKFGMSYNPRFRWQDNVDQGTGDDTYWEHTVAFNYKLDDGWTPYVELVSLDKTYINNDGNHENDYAVRLGIVKQL